MCGLGTHALSSWALATAAPSFVQSSLLVLPTAARQAKASASADTSTGNTASEYSFALQTWRCRFQSRFAALSTSQGAPERHPSL